MNGNENEKNRFDYRHIICMAITLGILLCGVLFYVNSLGRTIESCRDFGTSICYYFCELFEIEHNVVPTVTEQPKVPFFNSIPTPPSTTLPPTTSFPDTSEKFQSAWSKYWQLWITKENVTSYLGYLNEKILLAYSVILLLVPLVIAVYVVFKRYLREQNNAYDTDSRALHTYKRLTAHTYIPIKRWLTAFFAFIKSHRAYYVTWAVLWALYFNFFTIAIEFLAYYFYFVVTFDVVNIYRQVYKLFLDLSPVFRTVPLWAWCVFGIVLFDTLRKKIAYARLNHCEMKNRGFINARPIVFMVCGTMGKKKTTAITDMALSQEVMLRDKAFEKLLENDLKFPYFPWINLENELKTAMEYHEVYNLATVRRFIAKKRKRWEKTKTRERLFNYDYERYGLDRDDKLKVVNVWEVLETYAQLYFIYVIQSSLLISNYSVRVDNVLADLGNFPLWNTDFFKRDSRLTDSYSRHAHMLVIFGRIILLYLQFQTTRASPSILPYFFKSVSSMN